MNNKLITLLALDCMLSEMDEDYRAVPEEHFNLIESKVYESYGMTVMSSEEEIEKIRNRLLDDTRKYRDQLIKEI